MPWIWPRSRVENLAAAVRTLHSWLSHEVPTVSMFLACGSPEQGYRYGQHHPKVRFDDSVLWEGSAAYSYFALRWLEEFSVSRKTGSVKGGATVLKIAVVEDRTEGAGEPEPVHPAVRRGAGACRRK